MKITRLARAAASALLAASLSGCFIVREYAIDRPARAKATAAAAATPRATATTTAQTAQATPAAPAAPAVPASSQALQQDPMLSAVGIGVSDLKRSADFYINVMGMQQIATYNLSYMDEIVVGYPDAESYIVLMHWTDGSARNYKDLPIKIVTRVKDPVALAARIKAAGFEVTREPQPSAEVGGAIVGFAKDPDGYVLELLPKR